ncbi:hypothetical protein PV327_010504 [Microctonus hyperodae]|uniref:Major facilitator superfamily (MFS) profile domain-containing protein n=1 Tax=Microctonus hyperodae TaxID=165561 RepID=A0AA39KV10_MICHY|nr:hypothetical protein PV327_010504 [Microctonus hyperodae]
MTQNIINNKECGTIDNKTVKAPAGLGIRHWQCVLFFFGITTAYSNRLCLSLAIVAIKDEDVNHESGLNNGYDSIVLSSFFWGYTLMQVPSGYLAKTRSAKLVLGIGLFISGFASLIVPLANDVGDWSAICACRVIMGLSQACLLPCTHTLLSKWVPPSERGRLGSMAYSGAQFGTVITYPISGALIQIAGWRSTFYFFGGTAILWSCLFFLFGADSPMTSSRRALCVIGDDEKKYIESSLGVSETTPKTSGNPPWKSILTSMPFWALVIAHCGQNWGFWMLLTELPTYMARVLKFNYSENGLVLALPYLTMLILIIPVSLLSDWSGKKGVSRGLSRKVCNTIGHWGPALAILSLSFAPLDHATLPVIILIIAVGLNAGSMCGFQINHIDLSPNFAGILMSITNCVASVIAILAPLIVGEIVTGDQSDVMQWRIVFYITAAIYFLGNLIFIIFGTGSVQPWDKVTDDVNKGIVLSVKSSTVPSAISASVSN